MDKKKLIREMVIMQQMMNVEVAGEEWEEGYTEDFNKEINWLRCLRMELSELIDSTPWKHWKSVNAESDIENIKIETIDTFHFLMSLGLETFNISKTTFILNEVLSKHHCSFDFDTTFNHLKTIDISEKLQSMTFDIANRIKDSKSTFITESEFYLLSELFFDLLNQTMKFDDLYKLYIGKNCLNSFRQNNGYKDGTYIKMWKVDKEKESCEDNVIMQEILEDMNISENLYNTIYNKLEIIYSNLI